MARDTNSQYLPSAVARVSGHFGLGPSPSGALFPIVGYFVAAVNIVLANGAVRLDPEEGSIWAMILLFLSPPFVVPTSWPHTSCTSRFGKSSYSSGSEQDRRRGHGAAW